MSRPNPSSHQPGGSLRAAVLDLLAQAAPRPAALGAPSADEQEFLDTLRRIVARNAAEDLWCRYHSTHREVWPLRRRAE